MFLRNNHRWLVVLFVLVVAAVFVIFSPFQAKAQDSFNSLQTDIRWLRSHTQATLLFNVWGDKLDFIKHRLSKEQVDSICGGRGQCDNIGVNYGLPFGTNPEDVNWDNSEDAGMKWALMIADIADPQSVVRTVLEHDSEWIIRFGVGGDPNNSGYGFKTEQQVSQFLAAVGAGLNGKTVYAIAGPNEPDLETWSYDNNLYLPEYANVACGAFPPQASQDVKDKWYACVAPRIAKFMNGVCDAKNSGQIPANVELLTPAFNATSESFKPLVDAVKAAGGRFTDGCFSGMAINLYPAGQSVQDYWEQQNIDVYSDEFGLPIFVTETGPINSVYDGKENEPGGFRPSPGGPFVERETTSNSNHYVSPILGIKPLVQNPQVSEIRESLANQGYQAYCATPTYTIEPKFGGAIDLFIDNVRAGLLSGRDVAVDSSEFVDYSNASTPIFRDTERKYALKSDLEEFFAYSELGETEYGRTEIKSAPINSLLSTNQKCTKTVDTLKAQRDMCNKLAFQPDINCALFTHTISGTDYTVLKLLQEYEAFAGSRDKVEVCSEIVSEKSGVSEKFRYAMLNAPFSIEKAYRIAYLVGVIEQKPKTRETLFNFFSHSEKAQPRDEVVVLTFKIPDIGTNKGSVWERDQQLNADGEPIYPMVERDDTGKKIEETESGHTFWDDVMNLTRNVLIPRKMAEKMDLDGSDERKKMRQAAESATGQGAGSLIYCLNGQAPFGQGSATCNNPDVKAVTDIINGTWVYDKERISCEKISSEQTDTIGDSARLGPVSNSNNFYPKYGEKILDNIWSNNATNPPFQTVFQVYGDTWKPKPCVVGAQGEGSTGDCTTLTFYLVYPMGYDTETLEYVLARSFLTEKQFEKFSQDPDIKERFNIFDDIRELRAETNEEQFVDCLHPSFDDNGNRYCPEEEFTASLTSSQGPALFFGARLGYWVREIQKSFNRLESLAHKYLENCRTTEEFLLDQCGGVPTDEEFNAKAYCENNVGRSKITRGVKETELDRFKFYSFFGGPKGDAAVNNVQITDEQNTIMAQPSEAACTLNMSVRAVDSLTLILSGGIDIVPNNPGNILGCVGTVSVAKKATIRRLPPDYKAAQKAADPNWKPDARDEKWKTAETALTGGNSASEVSYQLRLRPGYYKIDTSIDNRICLSTQTWVQDGNDTSQDGKELGEDGYVIDFVDTKKCQQQACVDVNIQSNMEGGGPVFGVDDEGNPIVLYTIDKANEHHQDAFGCPLSFDYSTLKYNNTCGGGRAGDCNDLDIGADCGFWDNLIDEIAEGSSDIMRKGRDAYRAVYGRLPDASGEMACTHEGNGDPIFGNTIVGYNCDTYTNSLDSLRVFQKIVGFKLNWFETGVPVSFKIPPVELWTAIKNASNKHKCDPWLVLAVASSEGQEPAYANDPRPNNSETIGMFELTQKVWDDWRGSNNPKDAQCTWRQPPTFTDANRQGLNFDDRINMDAAVDTACRFILYTGMQKYPEDQEKFVNAFTDQVYGKENEYSMGWNPVSRTQAEYVFEFWKKARDSAKENPVAQPENFPYQQCQNGEKPSTPPGSVVVTPVQPGNGENTSGTPPTGADLNEWVRYWRWNDMTNLPVQARVTYMEKYWIDTALTNRQTAGVAAFGIQLSPKALVDCTLNLSPGMDPQAQLADLQAQAVNNGTSRAIGCAASVRDGDLIFKKQGNEKIRTVWIKPKYGAFANQAIGPIALMDVAAQTDLKKIHEDHGSSYLLDFGSSEFYQFIQSGYAAWKAPQDMLVCDTKEQCENLQFGE